MAIQIQHRRGSTTAHSTFTGAAGELTVDTTKNTVVVHDGVTTGGTPLSTDAALTAHVAASDAHSATDISNTPAGNIAATTVQAAINELDAEKAKAGANTDITSLTNLTGGALVNGVAGLGYSTGAGGTVTQATSKSDTVTLNKPCGVITMNNAALTAGTTVTFLVNNSVVASVDGVVLTLSASGTLGAYECEVALLTTGLFYVRVKNISAGSLSEALAINFQIIKGATS